MDRLDALVDEACRLIRLGDLIPAHTILRDVVAYIQSQTARTTDEAAFRYYAWLRQVALAFELYGVPARRVDAIVEDSDSSRTPPALGARLGKTIDALFEEAMNPNEPRPPSLERALDYIQANCMLPIGVGDVARSVGCTARHLRRMFTEAGRDKKTTPSDFIRLCRVRHAKKILVNRPSLPVEVVAEMCGFANAQAFRRAFKKVTSGLTPSEYRRRRSQK